MKPNILYIMTDQQSASMLSCADNPYLKTPALDSIAKNGVRFDRAYCTNPVCVPSRFSLFTGEMPSEINLKCNDTDEINHQVKRSLFKNGIGYLMKEAGYEAVYAGKQHLPEFKASDIGFDVLTEDEREVMVTKCVEYIKKKKDKPFFLVASLINPHDICYMAIRDFAGSKLSELILKNGETEIANVDKFLKRCKEDKEFLDNNCPPLPKNFMPQEDEPEAIEHLINSRPFRKNAREKYSKDEWRMHRYVYHRLTEMVDEKIGKLLDALKESNQEEDTVIIFTSDHGDMDSAHKLEHKTVFYEEASRIPLIISHKGKSKEGVVDSENLISNGLDLIPTLLDYANVTKEFDYEGRSFRPLAQGESVKDIRECVKLESELGRAIITRNFKYAKFYMGKRNEQLYDLVDDPYETKNVMNENIEELNRHRILFNKMFTKEE